MTQWWEHHGNIMGNLEISWEHNFGTQWEKPLFNGLSMGVSHIIYILLWIFPVIIAISTCKKYQRNMAVSIVISGFFHSWMLCVMGRWWEITGSWGENDALHHGTLIGTWWEHHGNIMGKYGNIMGTLWENDWNMISYKPWSLRDLRSINFVILSKTYKHLD